ncbi:MAG: hypothetical protein ACI9LN_003263, partial [Saprospiraceae bacterium]
GKSSIFLIDNQIFKREIEGEEKENHRK